MDGQLPSPGWSVTITRMVNHHPKDGHPPSKIKIYQKEEQYRHEIWHLGLTHKIKTRLSTMDGQPQSPGWSPTIPRMVTHGCFLIMTPPLSFIKFQKVYQVLVNSNKFNNFYSYSGFQYVSECFSKLYSDIANNFDSLSCFSKFQLVLVLTT